MTDTPFDDIEGLRSATPSVRAQAAARLALRPYDIPTRELMLAIQAETVPQVRRILLQVLETRQRMRGRAADDTVPAETRQGDTVEPHLDVAALIRHELSPAVGWIRLAADGEISDFAASRTNTAVRKLQRRIDGLAALIKSEEELNLQELILPDILLENWPDSASSPRVEPEKGEAELAITTDESLFSLLLSNVFQNAIDASADATGQADVRVIWGYTERDYWVTVTNPFSGDRLELAQVLDLGRSSKPAHQGQGLVLVTMVAKRLQIAINLEGHSGIASFTLSGVREHA